jgi:protein-S-isoprenylcysteine O-methyltransferase Ste14
MKVLVRFDIWAVLLTLSVGQIYRQFRVRKYQRFPEGASKTLRGVTAIPALAALICMFYRPGFFDGIRMFLPPLAHYLGLLVFNAAALLVLWSHVVLGKYWSGELATHSNHRLVDEGPYKYVRHPLYSAYVIMPFGFTLMTGNILVGTLMFIYSMAVAARVWSEEEMLKTRLGDTYECYMNRTGRFFPQLSIQKLIRRG